MLLIRDRDPGRVVSAILELPQTVDDQRHNLFVPYVTYNSAHTCVLKNYAMICFESLTDNKNQGEEANY